MTYSTLRVERREPTAWIWMNRSEVHNAFDEALIADLTAAFATVDADRNVRAIVLAGEGKSFSAGADLSWMRQQGTAAFEDNVADARRLADLYRTIALCETPTLARVHGAALGGGMGLAAVCDICVASTQAQFATSEVRLGIIPAVIGPYVVRAIGERQSYRYFQTGERISAVCAHEIGLVHEVVPSEELDTKIDAICGAPRRRSVRPIGCDRPDPRGSEQANRRCGDRGHRAADSNAASQARGTGGTERLPRQASPCLDRHITRVRDPHMNSGRSGCSGRS